MITINISKSKNANTSNRTEEILYQMINAEPNTLNRQTITDVCLIESTLDNSLIYDDLMQEITNKLYEVGFKNIKVHAFVGLKGLNKGAQVHIDVNPKLSRQPLSFVSPKYLNVFILSAESSVEYLEAHRLLKEENRKAWLNNSFKNKSIEAIAIEEYIKKIKMSAITVINTKNFKHEFEKPQNTFIPFENSEQRKIRIGHFNRTHSNYSFEKDRQIVTALIAKKIAQLESQIPYLTDNHMPHQVDQQNGLSTRVVTKLKSFFLTQFLPIKSKKINKSPVKLLQDLQLLNVILDKVEANQWRLILRENISLFKGCDVLPHAFGTTATFLNYLYKFKFDKANIILEREEQFSVQHVATAPIGHAHALIQNHDLDDVVVL